MTNKERDYMDNDNLFSQATEDISHLRWAIASWAEGTEDYTDTYILLEIFTRRIQANKINSILKEIEFPDEYKKYVDKLDNMLSNAERAFIDSFLKDTDRIQKVVSETIPAIISDLNKKLNEIVGISEDALLLEDKDLLREEFPDIAATFVRLFTDIHNILEAQSIMKGINLVDLSEQFIKLEEKFKTNFYHFAPLAKQLEIQRAAYLPSKKEWWYTHNPVDYAPKYIKSYKVLLGDGDKTENCPSYEKLVSYAFYEMPYNERQIVEKHVFNCDYCFNEVLGLRLAEETIPEKAIFKSLPVFAPEKQSSYLEKIKSIPSYAAKVFAKLEDAINVPLVWPVAVAAGAAEVGHFQPQGIYELEILHAIPEIVLLENPKMYDNTDTIKPLAESIYRDGFYYCIYGIYGENDVREIIGINQQGYLPLKIKTPDTDILIALIGKNENILIENIEKLLGLLNKGQSNLIENIVCLYVHVKYSA